MLWLGLFLGGCGLAAALLYPIALDEASSKAWERAKAALARLITPIPEPQEDLLLVSRLISSLRSGLSLDAALEWIAEEASESSRARIRAILAGRPGIDFLSAYLCSALLSGCPVLGSLQSFEKALEAKRKLQLRARSCTAQCRAQAEVLSWLPWVMALALFVIDTEWFLQAAASPLAWLLWAIALGLAGLGRQWIQRTLARTLKPRNDQERMEEEAMPDLVLRILSELSQGQDVETAAELAFQAQKGFRLPAESHGLDGLSRLRALLRYAARSGAPLRDDLLALLAGLQNETEARWEERVQRLPVALLGPLFLCFFPCSLLVLGGLLLPLLQGAL